MRSVGETQASIEMLVHQHLATCQARPPAYPLDLQAQILKAHGVVTVHTAFELQRKNPLPVTTAAGHKSISSLSGRDLKTAVVECVVIFPEEKARRFPRLLLPRPPR